jgi:hypothetical protein
MGNKRFLLERAMFYGLFLGVFWLIKYIFFMLATIYPVLIGLYWILTSLTLLFAFAFTKIYKIVIGGRIGFFHAWQFGILLYFFAALVVSLMHFVFYKYLAPAGYITQVAESATVMLEGMNMGPQVKDAIRQMELTPIRLAIQGILNNVFYGIILSIPIAALLCRTRISGIAYKEEGDNQGGNNQEQIQE